MASMIGRSRRLLGVLIVLAGMLLLCSCDFFNLLFSGPPVSNAGSDIDGAIVDTKVRVSGNASSGSSLTYAWTFQQIPVGSSLSALNLFNCSQVEAFFTPDVAGIYILKLKVINSAGNSTSTVKITAVPSSNLIGEYFFASSFNDSSGNNHNGTSLGGGTTYVKDRHGRVGAALSITPYPTGMYGNAEVDLGSGFQFTSSSSFTVSLWFNVSSTAAANMSAIPGYPTLVGLRATAEGQFQYFVTIDSTSSPIKIQAQVGPNNITAFGSAGEFTCDAWHNLVLVYDGTAQTITVYIDGLAMSPAPQNANYDYTDPQAFGPLVLGGGLFEGYVDDLKLYKYAMPASKVSALYSAYQ